MKTTKISILIIVCYAFLCGAAYANNLAIENVTITSQNTSAQTCKVQFDAAWSNSWRNGINRDAVWVFIKYSTDSGSTWSHATLKTSGTNPSGFSSGSGVGLNIIVPTDKKGAFIERSSSNNAMELLEQTDIQFVWDWGTDGLSADDAVRLKVFGIEMVYVPQASFYAGDGTSSTIQGQFEAQTSGAAFEITGEGAITLGGGGGGSLGNNNAAGMATADDFNDSVSKTLPADFPKGYNAFYIMKCEISQGQYRDFLNTLTQARQNTRTADTLTAEDAAGHYVMLGEDITSVANRQCIKAGSDPSDGEPYTFGCDLDGDGTLDESDDGEWIACNYLSWMDVAAFCDWSGLRPFTELEFEKACRGNQSPIADEYAWGNTTLETATTTLAGGGMFLEAPNQGNLNYNSCSPDGPFRVSSFARFNSTRTNAGAGYYGALDLSGNTWERAVTVGNSTGRTFTASHGDGSLSANGNADNSDWPGYVTSEVTGATGANIRGGGWGSTVHTRVSDRDYGASSDTSRGNAYGGRLARTAP